MSTHHVQSLAWLLKACLVAAAPFQVIAAGAGTNLPPEPLPTPGFKSNTPSDAFKLPPLPPAAHPLDTNPSGLAQAVRSVVFVGNTLFSSDELGKVTAPYLNRNLTDAEISLLAQDVSRYYIDHGYVSSGALPGVVDPQSGALTLQVIEGKLSLVRVTGNEGLRAEYVSARLLDPDGTPLNVDLLRERFQLLLNDPLIASANARLLPGEERGQAILDVDVKRASPYTFTAFVDNYRPPSIGANEAGANVTLRNLTGWGDALNLSAQTGIGHSQTNWEGSIGWRAPFNAGHNEIHASYRSGVDVLVEEPLASLDIHSRVHDAELGVQHDVVKSLQQLVSVGVDFFHRDSRNTLLGEPFSFTAQAPDEKLDNKGLRLYGEYSYRNETQVLAARLTHTRVRNNLDKRIELPEGAPDVPQRERIWLFQGQYGRKLNEDGTQLIAKATLQHAHTALDSLNQFAVGGAGTVRGYATNELVRDTGQVVNFELVQPVLRMPVACSLVPFYEYGRAKNHGEHGAILSSLGLAARLQWREWSVDIAAAHRLEHPYQTSTGNTVHAQLIYSTGGK